LAQINKKIDLSVTCPENINVPLVRADYQETENIFRISFEIFLAIASCIGGHILGGQNITQFEKVAFFVCVSIASISLYFSIKYRNKAKSPQK
jgi:hypothetical protein